MSGTLLPSKPSRPCTCWPPDPPSMSLLAVQDYVGTRWVCGHERAWVAYWKGTGHMQNDWRELTGWARRRAVKAAAKANRQPHPDLVLRGVVAPSGSPVPPPHVVARPPGPPRRLRREDLSPPPLEY